MTTWMVMSATTITSAKSNRKRCFDTNATDLPTERMAQAEADRRNAVERAAGHKNVDWYAVPQLVPTQLPIAADRKEAEANFAKMTAASRYGVSDKR